jgi:hypothetical protein
MSGKPDSRAPLKPCMVIGGRGAKHTETTYIYHELSAWGFLDCQPKKVKNSQVWWHMHIISALRMLRHEDSEFKASLGDIQDLSQKKKSQKQKVLVSWNHFREEYLKKTKNKNLEGYPRKRQGAKQQIKVQEYRKIKGINWRSIKTTIKWSPPLPTYITSLTLPKPACMTDYHLQLELRNLSVTKTNN